MSMITENTVVVRNEDVKKLQEAFNVHREMYTWLDNPVEVFNNGNISIWVFDCNGQQLGVEENVDFLILETNYLDDEPYYTQCYDENKGYCVDTEQTAVELIKEMVSEMEYKEIKEKISYSTEIIDLSEVMVEAAGRVENASSSVYGIEHGAR